MLVVSRKQNESIVFPGLGISVEIVRVAGKTVRVGIQAPDEVKILRGELYDNLAGCEQLGSVLVDADNPRVTDSDAVREPAGHYQVDDAKTFVTAV